MLVVMIEYARRKKGKNNNGCHGTSGSNVKYWGSNDKRRETHC